jgi:hypothetical protein
MSIDYLSGCFCEFHGARIADVAEIDEAEAFSIVEGMENSDVDSLEFPNVRTLLPRPARVLSTSTGSFDFPALEELPVKSAWALARHRGSYLAFPKLAHLGDEIAEAFGVHDSGLMLDGVKELSPSEAERLSMHSGKLGLRGLESLPARVAEHLAEHRGTLLQLGVTCLDDDAAEAIAKYPGELHLLNLKHISARAAAAFVTRQHRSTDGAERGKPDAIFWHHLKWKRAGRLACGEAEADNPETMATLRNCEMIDVVGDGSG